MSEQLRRAPLSPIELMQLRLRIIRAISRVHGTPAAHSQALDDMLRLVATVDSLGERLAKAQEQLAYAGADVAKWKDAAADATLQVVALGGRVAELEDERDRALTALLQAGMPEQRAAD